MQHQWSISTKFCIPAVDPLTANTLPRVLQFGHLQLAEMG